MATLDKAIRDFAKTMQNNGKPKTTPYDTPAEVVRTEGDIVWVHIPGGVDETPVKRTIDAKKGDTVQVRVSGGTAYLIGNASSPPTDDTTANLAKNTAVNANINAVVAKKTADEADVKANTAKEKAEAILIYDHIYEIQTISGEPTAVFTAAVYQAGIDIHEQFDPSCFTWYLKNEDQQDRQYLGSGYTVSVALSNCGYGSEVIGEFTTTEDSYALSEDNSNLTNSNNTDYSVRALGDSVRVRDLAVSTSIYDVEKLMVIGVSDEHLVSLDSTATYMGNKLLDRITNSEMEEMLV